MAEPDDHGAAALAQLLDALGSGFAEALPMVPAAAARRALDSAGIVQPVEDAAERRLMALDQIPVPLGQIASPPRGPALPAIGILVPEVFDAAALAGLSSLLTEHHHRPFARPIFLCRSLGLLPILGRAGLAVRQMLGTDAEEFAAAALRHGITQVRALADGRLLWSADDAAPTP